MKIEPPNWLLILAAAICFVEAAKFPKNDPGLVATAILGFFLLLKGCVTAPQPGVVILSGCILTAAAVAGDEGIIDGNQPLWLVIVFVAFVGFGFWQRIEKIWK